MRIFLYTCLAVSLVACDPGNANSAARESAQQATETLSISDVQGPGDASPYEGDYVRVSGVVTGDFQDDDADTTRNLGGFYITDFSDRRDASSNGIFVFDGDSESIDVAVGDLIEVEGRVAEFFGETQLQSVTVSISGSGNVATTLLPETNATRQNDDGDPIPDLEAYEGMLVTFAAPLTVTDLHNIERYGELLLSSDGRLMQFTNNNAPSVDGFAAHRVEIARRSILLDDGKRVQNARPAVYVDPQQPIRVGDEVHKLTGILRYSRASGGSGLQTYRLMPTEPVEFTNSNPRPDAPEPSGTLRVAGLNVLNYFTTPDTGRDNCGPQSVDRCRGADSASELARQRRKLVATVRAMNADIVGLVELENTADESLRSLVDAINADGPRYAYIDTGVIGADSIKAGFIYKPDRVAPSGDFAILDQSVDARFIDTENRPVLAQSFAQANGGKLTVAVNHLKSKGSDCNALGDVNQQDGQGECNRTRASGAAAMADWLKTDPTDSGDTDILIVGDLNAYHREDPVTAITERGYINVVAERNDAFGYSFVYRGQSGALDHAFASSSLASQITGAWDWHINADESFLFDYNQERERPAEWFDGETPYRSSDHDPLIIDLRLVP